MAGSLTDVAEKLVLDALHGVAAFAPTTPLKVALITVASSATDSTAGTEAVAGGNAYARQTYTPGAAAGTLAATSNTAALTYTNMPACTVYQVEVWDSNASPKRLWWCDLSSPKTLAAGDTFQIGIGQLSITLD